MKAKSAERAESRKVYCQNHGRGERSADYHWMSFFPPSACSLISPDCEPRFRYRINFNSIRREKIRKLISLFFPFRFLTAIWLFLHLPPFPNLYLSHYHHFTLIPVHMVFILVNFQSVYTVLSVLHQRNFYFYIGDAIYNLI